MTTTWKSGDKKPNNNAPNNTISGTMLSSWSRQQKLAMIASFAILGLLLAVSACSKQGPKPALVGVSSPAPSSATPATAVTPATTPTAAALPARVKKTPKKRPANVTYSDANSGVSFLYPRKFALASRDKAQPQLAAVSLNEAPMNFVQPGGVAVATVALPGGSYPGTDFASAFFNVNVNRSVSEQECSHFAFVDTRNADGEPVDAEKVKIGSTDMEMTSDFSANAIKQAETQYYHSYENGACYEYVLGLGTEGFATEGGIEHVNRDEVFAKLEKILASVKIKPIEAERSADSAIATIAAGKE
jgi:hypothetical protein